MYCRVCGFKLLEGFFCFSALHSDSSDSAEIETRLTNFKPRNQIRFYEGCSEKSPTDSELLRDPISFSTGHVSNIRIIFARLIELDRPFNIFFVLDDILIM